MSIDSDEVRVIEDLISMEVAVWMICNEYSKLLK